VEVWLVNEVYVLKNEELMLATLCVEIMILCRIIITVTLTVAAA